VERGCKKHFCLVLVKPSHYDDDGYVIQWLRSPIPSTSLAALYGLAQDCAERRVLGPDVEIDVHAFDETNTRIRCDSLAAMIHAAGAGMVMLVGVQSNQFPRALDLATTLRKRDIPVAIGGFHVSGTLSMLDGADPDLQRATAMGVSLFAGEAEGRLERVLQDADAGALAPLYNFMDDLPGIEGTPIPLLAAETVRRTAGGVTSFDAGRGCPYQCSFCTIINVQGRKSRHRSPADIEKIVRLNYAEGMRSFFITDDNFARNKDWERILDRLIHLREAEKLEIGFIIQVDTLCHKLRNFIEKCARAGVRRVFIGLENINPDNLLGEGSIDFEKMHPLECGFLRRKSRRDRRPGFPIEPAWRFYPKYLTETAVNQVRWIWLYLRLRRLYLRIKHDPERLRYTDFAMAAVAHDEAETRALFGTAAAQAYLTQEHRLAKIREGQVA